MREAQSDILQALWPRHEQFLSYLGRRVDPAVVEDILQDSYLRVLKHRDQLRDEKRLVGWFYRMLHNAAVDHHRRLGRARKVATVTALDDPPGDGEDAQQTDCAKRTADLVPRLKPDHREAIEVVYADGGSIVELARRKGLTRNNATVRLHRARQALRQLVERETPDCACWDAR